MKSDIAIRANNLGKKYLIGHRSQRTRNPTIRDALMRGASSAVRTARSMLRGDPLVAGDEIEEFWALRDVSFEIKRGDVIGVIGRNGAGKSTLLKILSRITEPSEGRVEIYGRVASLLEVGTGFHAELSGRENIYLNGAVLGMTRAEINRKFDEIVAFAEIDKFLDTPVKRYSSGMYVRLAFAVAAHLEPEILIVDEVLAVGDAEFQKKCLGKMSSVASAGRTVLFVSHNLAAVRRLTRDALLMQNGRLLLHAPTDVTLDAYTKAGGSDEHGPPRYVADLDPKRETPQIKQIRVETSTGGCVHWYPEPMTVEITLHHPRPARQACLSFMVLDREKNPIIHAEAYHNQFAFATTTGTSVLTCTLPRLRLNVGTYSLRCYLSGPPGQESWDVIDDVCAFQVERVDEGKLWGWREGACRYFEDYTWRVEENALPDGRDLIGSK